jgi:hypothetical protein
MEGESLPLWLQKFVGWAAKDGAKARWKRGRNGRKGRDPYDNVHRDYSIAVAVHVIVELCGFRPTRNPSTRENERPECGMLYCREGARMVSVINMSEANVAAIWRATKKGTSILALLDRPIIRRRHTFRIDALSIGWKPLPSPVQLCAIVCRSGVQS